MSELGTFVLGMLTGVIVFGPIAWKLGASRQRHIDGEVAP